MTIKSKIDPIEQHVIDEIRKLRLVHHLRQKDIATIIKTTTSFVGNVENTGNPAKYNLKHINLLADYFKVSPKFFFPEKPIFRKADLLFSEAKHL